MITKHIHIEKLIKAGSGSVYKLTILAAKRAMQLANGDKPLVDHPSEKVLETALREIAEGKICIKQKAKE